MTLEVLIADDEPPARRRLRSLLAEIEGVAVVGEAGDGLAAVEAIQRLRPALVLLDVKMPGLGGFEVIDAVGADAMPPVVFVTAHDAFAVDAFAVEAVDYLVKPIDGPRLRRAVERALRRGRDGAGLDAMLSRALPERGHLERIVVRRGESLVFVPARDIERITADGNYVEVSTGSERFVVRETLAHLASRLDPARFARVHRGEVVAVDAVLRVDLLPHGDAVVVLRSGASVRMSRRYADRLPGMRRGSTPG